MSGTPWPLRLVGGTVSPAWCQVCAGVWSTGGGEQVGAELLAVGEQVGCENIYCTVQPRSSESDSARGEKIEKVMESSKVKQ